LADFSLETAVTREHQFTRIAGLDEAGRGALAGPVVAAAVILDHSPEIATCLADVNDSKQLTPRKREKLFTLITETALCYGIGRAPADVVDAIGIIPATRQAMAAALACLPAAPQFLLVDGRLRLTQVNLPQQAIIRGDSKSLSIAAASILAKVARDHELIDLDKSYPQYGFARHKGYGTAHHLQALQQWGPCPIHRRTFAPIRKPLL